MNPIWLAGAGVIIAIVGGSIGAYDESRPLDLEHRPTRTHRLAVAIAIAGIAAFVGSVLWSAAVLLGALGVWLMGLGR